MTEQLTLSLSLSHPQGSCILSQMAKFHSFLWLNNILLCIYYILFIHSSINEHLHCFHILAIKYIYIYCHAHKGVGIFLSWWFGFLWINTQKWNFWIIWWFYFNILGILHIVFQSRQTNILSHQ